MSGNVTSKHLMIGKYHWGIVVDTPCKRLAVYTQHVSSSRLWVRWEGGRIRMVIAFFSQKGGKRGGITKTYDQMYFLEFY